MPRLIRITTRPENDFPVPYSDGYSLYAALLSKMEETSPSTSERIHDTDQSSITVSSLDGSFQSSERKFHKRLQTNETYSFQVGVTDPDEKDIFEALVEPFVLEDGVIELTNGELRVQEFSSERETFQDIVERGKQHAGEKMKFQFNSPTCIQFKRSDVTEMFPHRRAVFSSILSKWNRVVSEKLKIDLKTSDMGGNMIEKPDMDSLRTHSVVVNRIYDENRQQERPILRQGFTGECTYEFTGDAPAKIKNSVRALAFFSKYSGVGSAVSRGCGNVDITAE